MDKRDLEILVGFQQAQLADLNGQLLDKVCMMCNFIERSRCYENQEALAKEIASKQARIDELMLEWCPDELTSEQSGAKTK